MQKPPPRRQSIRRSVFFSLSARGAAALFTYRGHVRLARGRDRRRVFDTVRAHWASSLGLEPDDGAYLVQLATGSSSFRELGEALAICGQSTDHVTSTITRLLTIGIVKQHATRKEDGCYPTIEAATHELETALVDYSEQRPRPTEPPAHEEKLMSPTLRAAFFRVVAARSLLADLSTRLASTSGSPQRRT